MPTNTLREPLTVGKFFNLLDADGRAEVAANAGEIMARSLSDALLDLVAAMIASGEPAGNPREQARGELYGALFDAAARSDSMRDAIPGYALLKFDETFARTLERELGLDTATLADAMRRRRAGEAAE